LQGSLILRRDAAVRTLEGVAALAVDRTLGRLLSAMERHAALAGWEAWAFHPHALHQSREVQAIFGLGERLRAVQLTHETVAAVR